MKPRNQQFARVIAAVCVCFAVAVAHADAVTDWNAIMQATVAPSNPFVQGRNAAIVEVAAFEAVNTIIGDYKPYLGTLTARPGAQRLAHIAHHDHLFYRSCSRICCPSSMAGVRVVAPIPLVFV